MSDDQHNLRLFTWNLWFEDYLQIERLLTVLSYVELLNPHIIAFQELTPVADSLFSDPKLPFSDLYKNVPYSLQDWQWYWEGIYSRLPFNDKSKRYAFTDSEMGRGITVLHVPSSDLVVGCVHLESENEHLIRRLQFSEAIGFLDSCQESNKILMGDMNTRQGELLSELLSPGWSDVWEQNYPDKAGYTRDPQLNVMLSKGKANRLDRIYCKCPDFKSPAIRLIGLNQQVTENGEIFMPSDHFGVLLDLSPLDKSSFA